MADGTITKVFARGPAVATDGLFENSAPRHLTRPPRDRAPEDTLACPRQSNPLVSTTVGPATGARGAGATLRLAGCAQTQRLTVEGHRAADERMIREAIDSVNRMVAGLLPVPAQLAVKHRVGEASQGEGELWLPGAGDEPLGLTRSVVTHEYGHAILAQLVELQGKRLGDLEYDEAAQGRDTARVALLQQRLAELEGLRKAAPATDEAAAEAVGAQMVAVLEELEAAQAAMAMRPVIAMKTRTLVAPFQELFADMVTALEANDPDAVPAERSFAGRYDPVAWTEREEHVALNPVRDFVWHTLRQARGLSPATILSLSGAAIQAELEQRLPEALARKFALPPKSDEINVALIDRMRARTSAAFV